MPLLLRHLRDSNPCTRFCRPLPHHSVKMPGLALVPADPMACPWLHLLFQRRCPWASGTSGDGENRTRVHGTVETVSTSVGVTRHGSTRTEPGAASWVFQQDPLGRDGLACVPVHSKMTLLVPYAATARGATRGANRPRTKDRAFAFIGLSVLTSPHSRRLATETSMIPCRNHFVPLKASLKRHT